jgi:phage antirepressor YoqD-like protein
MNELVKNGDKRMTVKELSNALGVSERVVQLEIKRQFPGIVQNGKTTYIDEVQSVAIKVALQRHHNLEGTFEQAESELEMMMLDMKLTEWKSRRIAELSKQVDQQKIQIAELEPKADFYDAVTGSNDTIEIGEVAKVLAVKGLGRNNLFQVLREKGVLMQNNQPYQKYVDCGYFRTIESKYTKPDGTTHINIKTVVYQKGVDFIRKVVVNG